MRLCGPIASVCALCISAIFSGCNDAANPAASGAARIIKPAPGDQLLAGDTIDVVWENADIIDPVVWYNYNDTAKVYNDAEWRRFDTSSIISVSSAAIKLKLPLKTNSLSHDFQIKIEDASGAIDPMISEGNQIDHIVFLSPGESRSYAVGDTVHITWRSTVYMNSLLVKFGYNQNLFIETLTNDMAVYFPTMRYDWVVGQEGFVLPDTVADGIIILHQYTVGVEGDPQAPGLWMDRATAPITIIK